MHNVSSFLLFIRLYIQTILLSDILNAELTFISFFNFFKFSYNYGYTIG